MNVPQPMYISSRLMAAIDVADASGKVGTVEVSESGEWLVSDAAGTVLDQGADLRCPMASDYGEIMASLLGFLGACAESRRYGPDGENRDLFNDAAGEWAEQNSDELSMLEYELENVGA